MIKALVFYSMSEKGSFVLRWSLVVLLASCVEECASGVWSAFCFGSSSSSKKWRERSCFPPFFGRADDQHGHPAQDTYLLRDSCSSYLVSLAIMWRVARSFNVQKTQAFFSCSPLSLSVHLSSVHHAEQKRLPQDSPDP